MRGSLSRNLSSTGPVRNSDVISLRETCNESHDITLTASLHVPFGTRSSRALETTSLRRYIVL
ncbi:hypothetical protein CaCOL14_003614 [Colletotrichum acutatum]